MNYSVARNRLPPEEREAVTDEELRCGNQVSDAEFRERVAMDWLIGQPARSKRGSQAYTVEGVE